MNTHVALLRGINVGGRNLVPMAGLREMFDELQISGARTLLQSGNVVFAAQSAEGLATRLEAAAEKRFGFQVDFVIRSAQQWAEMVAANPFRAEAVSDPGHTIAVCLKNSVQAADVQRLREAIKGPELVEGSGSNLYMVYPDGMGTSKLTNAVIESKLGTRATARNWNTVLKLLDLLNPAR